MVSKVLWLKYLSGLYHKNILYLSTKRSYFQVMIALTIHDNYEMLTFHLARVLAEKSEG